MFTWIDFYERFALKLRAYANTRSDLLKKLTKAYESLSNKDIKFPFADSLTDIDPFSVFALFNGGVRSEENRREVIKALIECFFTNDKDKPKLPEDFYGIPVFVQGGNISSYFLAYPKAETNPNNTKEKNPDKGSANNGGQLQVTKGPTETKDDDTPEDKQPSDPGTIQLLWHLFVSAVNYADSADDEDKKNTFIKNYNEARQSFQTKARFTAGLFWIRPQFFLSLDSNMRDYLESNPNSFFGKQIPGEVTRLIKELAGKQNPQGDDYCNLCKACRTAFKNNKWLLGSEIIKSFQQLSGKVYDLHVPLLNILKSNGQIILHGAPGTGKTYLARKEIAPLLTGDDPNAKDQPHVKLVQFHPGYDYSDFIVGIEPVLVDGENGKQQVSFEWRHGIFMEFAQDAKKGLDDYVKKYSNISRNEFAPPAFVFVIDEINRADLSNVFGEVFSLMERDYRYRCKWEKGEEGEEKLVTETTPDGKTIPVMENEEGVQLPSIRKDEHGNPVHETMVIPENLYIIGTMNDIDRSVESMDFALRRRFVWKAVEAWETRDSILGDFDVKVRGKLVRAMTDLNKKICSEADLDLGKTYELGAAYFRQLKLYKNEDGNFDDSSYEALWEGNLAPILAEYLRGKDADGKKLEAFKKTYEGAIKEKDNK